MFPESTHRLVTNVEEHQWHHMIVRHVMWPLYGKTNLTHFPTILRWGIWKPIILCTWVRCLDHQLSQYFAYNIIHAINSQVHSPGWLMRHLHSNGEDSVRLVGTKLEREGRGRETYRGHAPPTGDLPQTHCAVVTCCKHKNRSYTFSWRHKGTHSYTNFHRHYIQMAVAHRQHNSEDIEVQDSQSTCIPISMLPL